jgi:hypothetical protein
MAFRNKKLPFRASFVSGADVGAAPGFRLPALQDLNRAKAAREGRARPLLWTKIKDDVLYSRVSGRERLLGHEARR